MFDMNSHRVMLDSQLRLKYTGAARDTGHVVFKDAVDKLRQAADGAENSTTEPPNAEQFVNAQSVKIGVLTGPMARAAVAVD